MASGVHLVQPSLKGGLTDLDQVAQGLARVLLGQGSWFTSFILAYDLREFKNIC